MTNSLLILNTILLLRPFAVRVKAQAREFAVVAIGIALILAFSFPRTVLADVRALPYEALPLSGAREPLRTLSVPATAYTSDPWETDDTPFITASGTQVRHGVLAANFLPIGTRVRMPEVYGDRVFIVEDRMNARYHRRVDIWMEEKEEARTFGIRQVKLEVF